MNAPIHHRAKSALLHASPSHTFKRANTAKIMRRLADQLGLVYFGHVNRSDEEYSLVRGITLSSTHGDHHYTVGSYKEYDISFVVRQDALVYQDRRVKDHYWTILTVDLHTAPILPHMYISHHTMRELMIAKYSTLTALPFGVNDPALDQFAKNYTVYGSLEYDYTIAALLPPPFLVAYAEHANNMSVEIVDNTVHVYATEKHPSRALLEKMLNFGIWMAQNLDSTARELQARYRQADS